MQAQREARLECAAQGLRLVRAEGKVLRESLRLEGKSKHVVLLLYRRPKRLDLKAQEMVRTCYCVCLTNKRSCLRVSMRRASGGINRTAVIQAQHPGERCLHQDALSRHQPLLARHLSVIRRGKQRLGLAHGEILLPRRSRRPRQWLERALLELGEWEAGLGCLDVQWDVHVHVHTCTSCMGTQHLLVKSARFALNLRFLL